MASFQTQRNILIDEILKYLKIDRVKLRVFSTNTLNSMLLELKEKRLPKG